MLYLLLFMQKIAAFLVFLGLFIAILYPRSLRCFTLFLAFLEAVSIG
jgi:hypothetical protein